MERFARVVIREKNQSRLVNIASKNKPEIQQEITEKWQSLIDTAARIANVPSGLIMRLNEDNIEVFLKSTTNGNPYHVGEQAKLVYGLYCETVIGTQKMLLVPDATKSDLWSKNNPDIDLNMIAYLGYPVNWPDGEVFGTVCFLDNKRNDFNIDFENLVLQIKQHLENDLELLMLYKDLYNKSIELKEANNLKSRFLSLISHDMRGSLGTINTFLKLIVEDFDGMEKGKLKPMLQSISQSTSTAFETLESMLVWAKNDIVQLEPEVASVDLIGTIEDVLKNFTYLIHLKGLTVKKEYPTESMIVDTDQRMLTVAIRNIISNAIKFNNKNGEIYLSIAKAGSKVRISIKDTGIGMTQETIDNLFFYSTKHSEGTMGESSSGIGLMLAREFLSKIGAGISVQSEPNIGTTIILEL